MSPRARLNSLLKRTETKIRDLLGRPKKLSSPVSMPTLDELRNTSETRIPSMFKELGECANISGAAGGLSEIEPNAASGVSVAAGTETSKHNDPLESTLDEDNSTAKASIVTILPSANTRTLHHPSTQAIVEAGQSNLQADAGETLPAPGPQANAPPATILPAQISLNTGLHPAPQQLPNSAAASIASAASPVAMASAISEPWESFWFSKRTPLWNKSVQRWKADNEAKFSKLEKVTAKSLESPIHNPELLFRLQPEKKSSKQTEARVKRWQPVLASVRSFAIFATKFDPHNIASIVCVSVLFGLDVSSPVNLPNRY